MNGGAGNDIVTLGGGHNGTDDLNGGAGNDTLTGGSGNSRINGAAGNDTLTGRGRHDQFTGGTDADIFLFSSDGSAVRPAIRDFSGITAVGGGAGEGDKITFSGFGNGTYIGDSAFVNGNGFQFRTPDGGEFIELDTDGDKSLDFIIEIDGLTVHTQLVQGDFQFL